MATAHVRELVSPSNMGLAYGVTATVALLATVIAPPISGLLYEQNPVWMYPTSIIIIGVSVLLGFRFLSKTVKKESDSLASVGLHKAQEEIS
ncbi:MAG: hypothetical protein HC806_07695 [Anaerolineae bacterium]|nr:hypothetical protein [Anaerolineae bacterium]